MSQPFSSEALSNEYLHINSCDRQQISINFGSHRPNGRIDYQLIYIHEGACFVKQDKKNEVMAPEGSVIIFLPNAPQIYHIKAEIPTISYYVHFTGIGCEEILTKLCLNQTTILNIGKSKHIEKDFSKMIQEFHIKQPFYEHFCNGLLLNIFSNIARRQHFSHTELFPQNNIIYEAAKIMLNEYQNNLLLADYAAMFNISTSRFTHLFSKSLGISPRQYIIKIKIEKAIDLLENTELSISQISELVGIDDRNYFSRIFKKHTGHSPSFYR